MSDCLFCKIAKKEIPAQIVYEDEKIIAFEDINKQAPIHILVVPKQHIESVLQINDDNKQIISDIHLAIKKIAKDNQISETGFRIINNCGEDAYQTVKHIHYHILGGKALGGKIVCYEDE